MTFDIGEGCDIHPTARINVEHGSLGPRSIIREGAVIEGSHVYIGTEAYLDMRARIGGGSCFDQLSMLHAGDFLHMGVDSHINIARPVDIGHEVGIGVETKIFTHGAYLPIDMGFPVQWAPVIIGDRVWLPNAWVNPGVTIGDDVVVAAKSLVNTNLPDGCLAGGIPARVLKENHYPKMVNWGVLQGMIDDFFGYCVIMMGEDHTIEYKEDGILVIDGATAFNIPRRKIHGEATNFTELFRNQLRRNGIRFRYYAHGQEYLPW